MEKKHWIERAQQCLQECLAPVPHEVSELDWKVRLSENKERLIEHLIASANHSDGAFLVFGVAGREYVLDRALRRLEVAQLTRR